MQNILKFLKRNIYLNNNFFLLWQGQAVSKFGTYLFDIAMIIWLKEATDNASMIAFVIAASQVPEIIVAPIGGTIADHFQKNKVMAATDFISGLVSLVLGLILYMNMFTLTFSYIVIIVSSIILGISASCFNPASLSLIPDLLPRDQLTKANSLYQTTGRVAELSGQSAGGIFVSILGAPLLFVFNGVSFWVSAISELFIQQDKTNKSDPFDTKVKFAEFKKSVAEGIRYCVDNSEIRSIFYIIAVYHLFISPLPVVLPFYISDTLQLENFWLGISLGVFGTGTITGFTFAGLDNIKINTSHTLLYMMFVSAVMFLAIAIFTNIIPVIISLFIIGTIVGFIVVNLYSYLQKSIDKIYHGRLFGLLTTITSSSFPVGLILYSVLLDRLRLILPSSESAPRAIFALNGIALILFTAFSYKSIRINKLLIG